MERLTGTEGTPETIESLLAFVISKTHDALWMHVQMNMSAKHMTHFIPLSKFIISRSIVSYLAASPIPPTFSILILNIRETMQRNFFH